MKKVIIFSLLIIGFCISKAQADMISTHKRALDRRDNSIFRSLLTREKTIERKYAEFKKYLNDHYGITYSADISFLGQRAAPNGKGTPWQTQYYGSANWDMFHSDLLGSGSAQIAYTAIRYWGKNAQNINNRIGVISSFNDYTVNANYFDELSYTHQFPGKLNSLSLTLGQFPMYNFDGGSYDSNQQINFLNYALSQNGSSTYPSASFGGYVTFTPNSEWSIAAGFQDARNISGDRISIHSFGKGKYTGFSSVTYTPIIASLGQGEYSLLYYYQPSVPDQPGSTHGLSLNLQQNLGKKFAIFARFNGTSDSVVPIKQSYALGLIIDNPFNRNILDQVGIAFAVNKLNKSVNGSNTRSVENVFETYWALGISNFMTITPDIQFYINPGANTNHKIATVSSLRATLMF